MADMVNSEETEVHRCGKRGQAFLEERAHSQCPFSLAPDASSLPSPLLTHHGSQSLSIRSAHPPLRAAAAPLSGQVRVCWGSCDSPSPRALTLSMNTWLLESCTSLCTTWTLENSVREKCFLCRAFSEVKTILYSQEREVIPEKEKRYKGAMLRPV